MTVSTIADAIAILKTDLETRQRNTAELCRLVIGGFLLRCTAYNPSRACYSKSLILSRGYGRVR